MKSLVESINEASRRKYRDLDFRLEELNLERSEVFDKDNVPYKQNGNVYNYLLEISGDAIVKPFNSLDKKVLDAFGIDWKNVEVYRHITMEDHDYAECIVYTPKDEWIEGEEHDYAVEDIYPVD